jgi:3-phenylpropionate/trans-cinnamate dioxygenase ferredoxin subunit
MSRHVVGKIPEIPPGSHKIVEAAGRQIGVFNVNGEFFALLNRCPHGGAELCKGEFIRCPFHGWEFEISTGQSYCAPDRLKIRKFDVAVESGNELVKGPYVAESYEVRVEDDYVVLTV